MKSLNIFYRLSDKGENKERLSFINNKICLDNFLSEFPKEYIEIVADNVEDETMIWLQTYKFKCIHRTYLGNSGSFWFAYKKALNYPLDSYIYFVENDYIHKPGSLKVLNEGLEISDYTTLYDHPCKYYNSINSLFNNGVEKSKVFLTSSSHWKTTKSTTMTFASKVSILKKDKFVFKIFTIGIIKNGVWFLKKLEKRRFPADHRIFSFLTRFKSRVLISPVPGFSTHGEIKFLSPLIDWKQYVNKIS
jgi:hypothetical protein